MTRDISPDLSNIRLFLTEPHDCSYLSNRSATTAFVDPALPVEPELYDRLSESGFRRSGQYLYTPYCHSCNACLPARIPIAEFAPNRQQKRCAKRNQDLVINVCQQIDGDEHFKLYSDYICQRHSDGDMYPPTRSQYDDFIGSSFDFTRFIEFRQGDKLIACSVIDVLNHGVSAIYTYYGNNESERSLGTMAILTTIDLTKQQQLPYLYMGYWIKACRKMRYKTRFQPVELLVEGKWRRFKEEV